MIQLVALHALRAKDYERKIRNLLAFQTQDMRQRAGEILELARQDKKVDGRTIRKIERLFD